MPLLWLLRIDPGIELCIGPWVFGAARPDAEGAWLKPQSTDSTNKRDPPHWNGRHCETEMCFETDGMTGAFFSQQIRAAAVALLAVASLAARTRAQSAPQSPSRVWHAKSEQNIAHDAATQPKAAYEVDPSKLYTLAELIDLAQSHNPETRVAWESAKSKAASLGIARAELFPTIAAVTLAETARQASLIGEFFHRQTLGVFEPVLHVEYLVFDFGGRNGAIDVAKANLLGSDLAFNDTHRKIIFQVASAYYSLLNAQGQREAAEVSLFNAQTVEEDAESLISGPRVERSTSRTASRTLFLRAKEFDVASVGSCRISDLSRDRAGQCRNAECGTGESAGNGDGGTVVRDPRLWRCLLTEDHRHRERPHEKPAHWARCNPDYLRYSGDHLLQRGAICPAA